MQETAPPSSASCGLCGLPADRSPHKLALDAETRHFCCPGCLHVYQILNSDPNGPPPDFKKTDLYRACVEAGIIPGDPNGRAETAGSAETAPARDSEAVEDLSQELSFRIGGMWCQACASLIEAVLRRTPGVIEAEAHFLSDSGRIKYLPHKAGPRDILARVTKLGYAASPFPEADEKKENRIRMIRLGVAAILTMNIMLISISLYFGFFQDLGESGAAYLSWPIWLMATPVVFHSGLPILQRAWIGLRHGLFSMYTLVAMGCLSAYFFSLVQLALGSLHLYFDTAAMLITLILLGEFIEIKAREKASGGLTELHRLAHRKVRLIVAGRERWVPSDGVEPGAEFEVRAGEHVPVDGRVAEGRARVDASILTGESRPIRKSWGDEVPAGVLLLDGGLRLKAVRAGADSSLNRIVSLIQEALAARNPTELLADRVTRWLVPAVLALALATAIILLAGHKSAGEAVARAVTILVITCPCALGVATPLAKIMALGAARAKGIIVRDPAALEMANDLDVIVFDKTGTLTEGRYLLRDIVSPRLRDGDLLRLAASVELHSDHFLAREMVRKALEWKLDYSPAEAFEAFEGAGVAGRVDGREIVIGSRAFLKSRGLKIPADLEKRALDFESRAGTVVQVGVDRETVGLMAFGDGLKDTAAEAVDRLRRSKIEVHLVSGDSARTTQAIADRLGIENYRGDALPGDKVEIVKALQRKGLRVGMAGDGINDAAALARADVGFALNASFDIPREASDIHLPSGDPARIGEVLRLSAITRHAIRQNLFLAFFYNLLGLPLAVLGWMNPLAAVAAMFASSLAVIGNTLRIAGKIDRDG